MKVSATASSESSSSGAGEIGSYTPSDQTLLKYIADTPYNVNQAAVFIGDEVATQRLLEANTDIQSCLAAHPNLNYWNEAKPPCLLPHGVHSYPTRLPAKLVIVFTTAVPSGAIFQEDVASPSIWLGKNHTPFNTLCRPGSDFVGLVSDVLCPPTNAERDGYSGIWSPKIAESTVAAYAYLQDQAFIARVKG